MTIALLVYIDPGVACGGDLQKVVQALLQSKTVQDLGTTS